MRLNYAPTDSQKSDQNGQILACLLLKTHGLLCEFKLVRSNSFYPTVMTESEETPQQTNRKAALRSGLFS
jgi:hypothetical protein